MWLLLLQFACTGSDSDSSAGVGLCSEQGSVSVAITSPAPSGAITSDLLVEGQASSQDGLALVGVSVAGVAAESVLGNYVTWKATVPYSSMLAMTGGLGGNILLCPVALDLCGERNETEVCQTVTVGTSEAVVEGG